MTLPTPRSRIWSLFAIILILISPQTLALSPSDDDLRPRTTYPYFPDTPPSCQICAPAYPNISSCAAACYLFQNVTEILFNPSGFIDVIKCSCTDTFQSAFPQCVDCFIQTNQTGVLQSDNLPSVISGMRQVCAFASTLFGGVASADGQVSSTSGTPSAASASATSTGASSEALQRYQSFRALQGAHPILSLTVIAGVISGILCL